MDEVMLLCVRYHEMRMAESAVRNCENLDNYETLAKAYELTKQTFDEQYSKVETLGKSHTPTMREQAIQWWDELGGNPLLRTIKQGELTEEYYGQLRRTSSLTGREIEHIYVNENNLSV